MFRISMVIYPGRIDSFRKSFRSVGSSKRRTNKPEMEKFMAMAIRKEAISELDKAKYTRRWRGKDGRYQYEYGPTNPIGRISGTASDKMRQVADIMRGRNLPESTWENVPVPSDVNAKERSQLNRAINSVLPGDYYDEIPISTIQETLNKEGLVIIQEDGVRWSGMLIGADSEDTFDIGRLKDGRMVDGRATYKPITNTTLRIQWHKMPSGRYEVLKYLA